MARNQIQNMGRQAHLNVHGLCWFASESLLKFEMLVSAGSFLRNKKCVHPRKLGLELALLHTFAIEMPPSTAYFTSRFHLQSNWLVVSTT